MSWPEAFVVVGSGFVLVALVYVLVGGEVRASRQSRAMRRTEAVGRDREFMPGWTLDRIIEDPAGYVDVVRKAHPKPFRNS